MLLAALTVIPLVDISPGQLLSFSSYLERFNKTYSDPAEYARREAAFNIAATKIKEHNSEPSRSWDMGFSDLTDRDSAEWNALSRGRNARLSAALAATATPAQLFEPLELPTEIDWRTKGVVSPVKNQGACGSCWAFSATESIESNIAINTGKLPVLAPQELVDCVPNPQDCGGTGGCEGATQPLGFKYAESHGMAAGGSYPYRGHDGTCEMSAKRKVAGIKSYVELPANNYTALMHAVATVGPISISVDASRWSFYSGGIYDGSLFTHHCGTTIDHAVQLVGYGTERGKDYWIVRNSWGAHWGEEGYIRIRRYGDGLEPCAEDKRPADGTGCKGGPKEVKVCGLCGILSSSSYPTGGFLADGAIEEA